MAANAEGASATFVTQIGTKGMCDGTQPSGNSNPFSSCGETNDLNTSHTLLNEPPDIAVDPSPDPVTGTRGSVYIADGYGNHRIVVYTTADGGQTYQYNRQWGTTCMINGVASNSQACPAGTFGASPAAATRIASSSAMTGMSMPAIAPIAEFRCSPEIAAPHRRPTTRNRCACRVK